jgi:hypothetical protein
MHNPFLLHPQQLQKTWKDLRAEISTDMSLSQKLSLIQKFWNQAPIGSPFLDYLDTGSWPDPWTLIDSKNLDINSTALGMFYTLLLSDDKTWTGDRLRLLLLRNRQQCWERLVCEIDHRWLLNYDRHRVVDATEISDITCLHTYKYDMHRRRIAETDHYDMSQIGV